MARVGPARKSRRHGPRQEGLDPRQKPGERFRLRRRHAPEQASEPPAEQGSSRTQRPLALLAEGKRLAPAIVRRAHPLEETRILEPGEKLRDGGRGDRRPPGELGSDDVSTGDRLESDVLRRRQRRFVTRE